ncbi:PIR Superfamily Protein [Plasmodium ovale curtisi]|uniref:PIR Superfamily Protein n=1 Tax=Plasmodium ovale curtisi TaxID=864141 RepID=A0A1A8X4S2_PLAOA|nr:PIR Superfamily Protein [Plasmodium ovale curtisi]
MMSEGISENYLPSVKFENDLKTLMNYTTLEGYVKKQTTVQDIDNWIQNFQTKVDKYLKDSSRDTSLDYDKRCKHFNYLIKVTISKITSLPHGMVQTGEWSHKIKEWIGKLYTSNPNLMCEETNTYTTEDNKILGTFCEDSDFIKKKLSDIQRSKQCQNIIKNISTRKELLKTIFEDEKAKSRRYTEINEACSIKNLNSIFPSITCSSSIEPVSETDAHTASDNHFDTGESRERLRTQSSASSRDLSDFRKESLIVTGEGEPTSDSSSNAIGLVSLPIFGALAFSFVLYRYTPLGSKFHASFRNNEDISNNQDYETTNEMLSNISNSNDMYSRGMQYNVSYQTL